MIISFHKTFSVLKETKNLLLGHVGSLPLLHGCKVGDVFSEAFSHIPNREEKNVKLLKAGDSSC